MSKHIHLGTILGIDFRLDYSWLIAFVLGTWSLAGYYLPGAHPGWSINEYWIFGVITSGLLFASVVAHKLAHTLVARAYGTPATNVTLFVFGGAAHIGQEPPKPHEEVLIALAGPGMSLALATLFYKAWRLGLGIGGSIHALAGWLAWLNLMLFLTNLIPAFPLDGGRILRAIVWGLTGDSRLATIIAAGAGRLIAFGFIFYGIWQIFGGNWADGLWIAFIGWFLDSAATQSVRQLAVEDLLAGHTAREVLLTDCPHVLPRLTLDVVVDQVAHPSGRRCFPVMEGGKLRGLLTLGQIAEVPRQRWPATRVADVMVPLAELKFVQPEDALTTVLGRMAAEDVNQLPVLEGERFLGIVSRDTLLNFLRARAELAT